MRPRISIWGFVRPWSVRGPSVRQAFLKYRGNRELNTIKHRETHRIKFLDASTHLYKRLCPSVGPWVRRSVGPSVRQAFLKYRGNRVLRTTKQVNSSKFKKIQENSRKFRPFRYDWLVYTALLQRNSYSFSYVVWDLVWAGMGVVIGINGGLDGSNCCSDT